MGGGAFSSEKIKTLDVLYREIERFHMEVDRSDEDELSLDLRTFR